MIFVVQQGLIQPVDIRPGGLRAEAQPDDTGSHPLRQAQSRHDLTGLAVMTGGACGYADPLTAKIVYHVLAGPARHGNGQHMGGCAVPDDLQIRDGAELFDGTVTADEAKAKIEPQKAELEAAAREVIEREGYDYPVSVNVVNEYFATRCYGDLTMPAGRYTAVKVVIGEGAGHNWWCVMFPPLCLPAAQDRGGNIDAFLDGDELKVVESSGRYEPRFKIVEIIEELREKTSPEN